MTRDLAEITLSRWGKGAVLPKIRGVCDVHQHIAGLVSLILLLSLVCAVCADFGTLS